MKRISIIAGAVALIAAAVLVGCNLFTAGLSVSYNGANIAYGSTHAVGSVGSLLTFTITNSGSNTLHITGNISATSTSGTTTVNSVSQPGSTTLAVNATTTFGLNLAGSGPFSIAVSIPNDSGQNPFTFTVTGSH